MFRKNQLSKNDVGLNQTIHFENIISRYYQVDLKDFSSTFEDFVLTVVKSGYTPKSNFFYAINSDLEDPIDMILQVFIPVEEDKSFELPSEYQFQSYFEVINMLSVRVEGSSEDVFSEGIRTLVNKIVEMDVELASPPFYFVNQIENKIFTDIMIKTT